MDEKDIKDILIKENEEFRKIFEEHQKCEQQLAELRARNFILEEDRLKEKELKKIKLRLKDEMYRMIMEYKKQSADNG